MVSINVYSYEESILEGFGLVGRPGKCFWEHDI